MSGPWAAPLLGILCFANSLGNNFAYDDQALVVDNPRIRTLTDFRGVWLSDWWYPSERPSEEAPRRDWLYRPLTLFTFALNYAAGGYAPFGYHLVNVLLHAGVCLLVWHFARRLTEDACVAGLAAALFAVHPVHVEAVANIVGRAEVLAALLLLGGLLLLLPRAGSPSPQRTLGAAAVFFAALLAKETAICYPAVALLVLHARGRGQPRPWSWWLRRTGVLLLPLAIYLPLRYMALEYRLLRSDPSEALLNALVGATPGEHALGVFTVLGHYVRLLIVPATLSCDYGLAIVDPSAGFTGMTLLGLVAAGGGAAALVGYARRNLLWRQAALLTALTLASYVLISNAFLLIGVALAERLMYWPSVPALLLVAVGIAHFWQRYCVPGRRLAQNARLLRGLGVLLVAALGLRSVVRNVDWHDTFTLCARDVRTYPQGAHLNKGYALDLMRAADGVKDPRLQREMLETAEQHLAAALRINPAYGSALALRARIRAHLGDTRGAQRDAESALLLEPLNHEALFVLSQLPGASENAEQRAAELRTATTTRPDDAALQVALGAALLDLKQPAAARRHFERALALEPDNVAALRHLGQTLAALGREDEAIATFRQVLALAPDNWSTHANLSWLLAHRDVAAALHHAQRACELEPRELRANLNLAEVYVIAGQQDKALQVLRSVERLLEADSPFKPIVQARIKRLERR